MDQARIDAKARGEKVYDGKPCVHGHGTGRYVSTGGCIECGRISALAAYHKRRDRLKDVPVQEPAVDAF
jgi:hypothetical protein